MSNITWKRLDKTQVTKIGYRTIVSKTFWLPNGTEAAFDCINSDDWQAATILAFTDDNKVIVARQFRPGPEMIMDELPGGLVDKNEDAETAVQRELLEETGYKAQTVTFLGTQYYDGYTCGKRQCFLATGCTKVAEPELGPHEFIEVALVTVDGLLEITHAGKMTDPGVVLLAYDELQKRRGEHGS